MRLKKFIRHCAAGVMALVVCVAAMPGISGLNKVSAAQGSLELNVVEQLGRGISAVNTGSGMLVSWRYLANDTDDTVFKLYRNGILIYTSNAGEATCYLDANGKATDKYTVESQVNGVSVDKEDCKLISDTDYLQINLTPPTASDCTYSPNDCSVGDADGDGEYEIFLKWDPSNSQDNSISGVTGNVYIDCIKLDGTRLWRIDLGPNIRAGAHYTQFLVADFDCDGYAEMTCKTSDGTVDGTGKVIGDASKKYANSKGYILTGNEYYTLFDGRTGAALDTVNYNPARGTVSAWGDSYGNRVDRFLGTVAYLDGVHPSAVTMRGYYTRMTACAYDVVDKKLVERWFFDTGFSSSTPGYGDGNHNCMPADVDGDGRQEIITGNTCIDDNGELKWCLNMGHGDAMHVGDFLPDRAGLELWICHEDKPYGVTLIDASKGTKIFHVDGEKDTGRCCADNVWSGNPGGEFWGLGNDVYDGNGNLLSCKRPAINFLCYWDGDLEREILNGYTDTAATISKMNENGTFSTLKKTDGYYTCNTTKGTPCLSADIFGDWREEVIVRASDSKSIRIYCTTYDTDYRIATLMHNPQYRNQVSAQQTAYNQPPHASFYLGSDAPLPARPNVAVRGVDNSTGGGSTEGDVSSSYFNHFTGAKNNNSLYTITGNYSNSKGTVTYAGTSYAVCLKMESATNVSFSTPSAGKLTLVFAESDNTGAAKVDGTTYASDANGVVTVELAAGSHTITKANSTNLFIINFEASGSTENVGDSNVVTSIDVSSTVTSSESIKEQTKNDVYQVRDVICSFDDSSINRATSQHFQIIWGNGDTTGTVTYDFIVGNLINLENIRSFYINELGMKDIGISQNKSISGYYKTNVYVSGTGLSEFEDDWAYMAVDSQSFAYLFLAPGAMRVDEPSWVVPHELAHAFTYHQGGSIEYAWYEATANWFRDQYLGSKYYAYGGNTYGPTSDFFAPYMINSSYYVPHMLNWYDTWPIFLYISENPDNIDGLGMELMHKIFEHDGSNESMYDTIQNLSGVSIKTILGGMSRRLATMDFSRQEHYLNRLNNDTLSVSGNYEKIYTTLNSADSDGWQSIPSDRAPMQTGFNIIPLDVDLTKNKITVEFVNTSSEQGSDFRTSIVTSTKNNLTRYSNMLAGDGTAEIQLNGDETKAYLVICATPDVIERFEVDWNSSAEDESTRFSYKVRITASDNEDDSGSSETTPSVTISLDATTLTADNGSAVTATTLGNGYIKVTGALVYKTAKDSAGNVTNNVTGIAVPNSGAAGLTVKVNGTATLVVTASSSGSTKTSSIAVVSAGGTAVAEKNGLTSVTGGSSAKKDFTYELTTGEYTVVCPTGSAAELRVIGISGTGNFVAYEASSEPEPEKKNGLYKNDNDGLWYYYVDDVVDTSKTGLVQGSDSVFWYVKNGVIDTSYTGFVTNGAGTWYVAGGKLDTTFTGLGKDGDKWVAVFNGKAYPEYTGLVQNAGYFWYVNSGTLDTTYTGFYENENGKWYVANGKVDTTFKGLGKDGDKWIVVLSGKHSSTYTGLIQNGGSFWYVKDGVLDTEFSGIAETGGNKWLVATGKLCSDYSGTYTDSIGTYTIVNGKVIE